MGLQWGRTRPAMGPAMGYCNGRAMGTPILAMGLQWACNGIAMGLQWHFDVPAMGFSHVYIIIWCGLWTELQAHGKPIASRLQESLCANKLTSS